MSRTWVVKENAEINALIGKKKKVGPQPFVDVTTKKNCPGSKAAVGDNFYIFEKGFIYQKGKITKVHRAKEFKNYDYRSLIDYYHSDENLYKNTAWWGLQIIEKAHEAFRSGKTLYVLVKVGQRKPVKNPVFVGNKCCPGQGHWHELKNSNPNLEDLEVELELDPEIPTELRTRVLLKFLKTPTLMGRAGCFDVDHVVPKSLGGPGNIEENLRPLLRGINIYKGNRVPKGLFKTVLTERWRQYFEGPLKSENIPQKFIDESGDDFINDVEAKRIAKNLVHHFNKVQDLKTDRKKDFYREVRRVHFPELE